MEKTLSMGEFTELNENEVKKIDGGLFGILVDTVIVVRIIEGAKANAAQNAANNAYNNQRSALINQMKNNPEIVTSIPQASRDYFCLPDGGYKGSWG